MYPKEISFSFFWISYGNQIINKRKKDERRNDFNYFFTDMYDVFLFTTYSKKGQNTLLLLYTKIKFFPNFSIWRTLALHNVNLSFSTELHICSYNVQEIYLQYSLQNESIHPISSPSYEFEILKVWNETRERVLLFDTH